MDLQSLIKDVEKKASTDDPLERLAEATRRHDELTDTADQLLDHFIQAARDAGCSWAQIGSVLGVTKQAAQQRHGAGLGLMGWLRKRAGQKGMFGRFTDRARTATMEAQQAARDLGHNYVGTEHLLLALAGDPGSVAGKALASWGIAADQIRGDILEDIGRGKGTPRGHVPFTPRAKKVLELAVREALALSHDYVGTEHLLLGLVREGQGVGAKILARRGVTTDRARKTVTELLAAEPQDEI